MPATNYFWDPVEDNLIEEYDDNGETIVEYETEPDLYGNLISQERDGITSYYHYDGQGSTLALTSKDGDVTDEYAYNAFGETTEQSGTTANTRRYVGELCYQHDVETNEYYVRSRQLSPSIARWLSLDKAYGIVGTGRSLRPYQYVANNSINQTDPSGLQPMQEAAGNAGTSKSCSSGESECVNKAIEMAKKAIVARGSMCFVDLAFCPGMKRSACVPDILSACLIAVLEATHYRCADRGKGVCHPLTGMDARAGNLAHTDTICGGIKTSSALGAAFELTLTYPYVKSAKCEPCSYPISYANTCEACESLAGIVTWLCRDKAPDRSISGYCKDEASVKGLAVLLVHEAAHSCVGGHASTGGKPGGEPSCDACNRNDSYDIEKVFANKCLV